MLNEMLWRIVQYESEGWHDINEDMAMLPPGKRNYILLSIFDFLYLFAWSATMAFFVIWTTQHLDISATQTGLLFSINAFIALLMQPFFGFISDKFGLKKKAHLDPGGTVATCWSILYLRLRSAFDASFLAGCSTWWGLPRHYL